MSQAKYFRLNQINCVHNLDNTDNTWLRSPFGPFVGCGLLPGQLIDHVDELLGLVLLLLLGHLLHGVGGRVLHVARDGVDAARGGQGAS